jgi:8-oxo-dGTP pyrophosphatase MutT (NUDIX family)
VAEAALREVQEETGYCRLRILQDLGVQLVEFDNPYDGCHYSRQESYFLMDLDSLEQTGRPVRDAQFLPFWSPLAEADSLLTFESERAVMRRAQTALAVFPLKR